VVDTALLEVNVLALDGIEPTPENIANGSYPVTRPLNLVTQTAPDPVTESWIEFIQSEKGRQLIENAGHTPAP